MAILSITPANVGIASAQTQVEPVMSGEAISHGQPVRQQGDGLWYRAGANSLAEANAEGISNGSTSGPNQPFQIVRRGPMKIGATVGIGVAYYAASTLGGIDTEDSLVAGKFPTFLGFGIAAGVIDVDIKRCPVAKA